MLRLIPLFLLSLASASSGAPTTNPRSLSANVYTDHFEKHLGRDSVASYNITYTSSVDVSVVEYGNHSKHCQYAFSSFTLSRRFSYDILHQSQPYGVRHMQLGTRTWIRASPAANGDVKGSCSAAFARIITPAGAAANTLGSWKDLIEQDDAIVRRLIGSDTSKRR